MAERYDFYVHDNRKITFNLTEPIMREDSGVTDFVFHIPKILNELEVSDWQWWLVFVNAKKEKYSIALTLSDDPESPLEKNVATYTVDYAMSIKAGSVQFALEAINAGTGGAIDNEWHTLTYETKVKETLQGNQAEYAETESDIISALLEEVRTKMNQIIGGATPTPVKYKAQMTDPKVVYLYIGSEPNEHAGHWYYHNGTTFVSGGVYGTGIVDSVPTQGSSNAVSSGGVWSALNTLQAQIPQIDPTLTQPGQAADAKEVGDEISGLKSAFDDITISTENIFDMSVFDGVEGITKDANGYYTGTGQAFQSAFGPSSGGVPGLSFTANRQYYLSVIAYTDGNADTSAINGLQFTFYTGDNTRIGRKSILNSVTTPEKTELFSTTGNSVGYMTIGVSNSALNIWHVKAIMLIASSIAVDYMPHLSANDIVVRQKFTNSVYKEDLTGRKIANGYISTQNISVGSTLDLTPVSNIGMGYFIADCKKDDCFIVTTTGLSLATLPWVFIDNENKVVQYASGIFVYTEYPIIAPSDGKLVINSAKTAENKLIKINNSELIVQTGEAHFIRDAKKATRWLNKRIVTFGDSRTWYDGHLYTENAKSELQGSVCVGYQEQMRKLMMAQIDNQGASGETSAEICTRICAFDFTGYDAVFLEGGVNDFVKSSQVTVGELAPIGSTFDTTTIYGAWQSAVEHILTNYPSVLIYMDIPAIAWTSAGLFPYSTAKIKGEIAELYNLPCLDLYKKSGINEVNRDYWYCDDVSKTNWRLHFNDYGNALIGQKIAGFLSTY